jgi:hypothetical protein
MALEKNTGKRQDTWLWDGGNWSQQPSTNAPPARQAASLAYDTVSDNVILFGGSGANGLPPGDTWAWSGSAWTQLTPGISPTPPFAAGLANYPSNGSLLFGGYSSMMATDTWAWQGTNWIPLSSAASPASEPIGLTCDNGLNLNMMLGLDGTLWSWNGQ